MTRLDDDTIATVVAGFLAQHPHAPVAAIAPDGRFCPVPESFPLGDRPAMGGTTYLDLVRPSDRPAVLAAFANARAAGASRVVVRFLEQPDQPMVVHFVDTRQQYGVMFGIAVDGDQADSEHTGTVTPIMRPRLGRMEKDELGTIIDLDEAAVRMLGWTREQSLGRSSLDYVHPDDHERAIDSWLSMATSTNGANRWRGRYVRGDGTDIWIETTNANRLDDPAHPHVASELVDVSDEMKALDALRANERFLRRITEALPVGVVEFDAEGAVAYANERVARLLGSAVTSLAEFEACVAAEDRTLFADACATARHDDAGVDVEVRLVAGSAGTPATAAITVRPSIDDGLLMCLNDVTERARLRRELEVFATFDELTGCHNRASTMRQLASWIAADRERGTRTAAVFVDLDRFKQVNDRFGHAVGDGLLRAVARRLASCARLDQDIVGRIGGDEFLLVFPALRGPVDMAALLERVTAALRDDETVDGHRLSMAASIGGALGAPGLTADELVARADAAMYDEKRRHHARMAMRRIG